MKLAYKSILFLLSTALAATLVHIPTAMAQANPPATKLAVINVLKLFNDLDEKNDADRDMSTMKKDFDTDLQNRQKAIENMQGELDKPTLYKAGSEEYKKLQDDLLQKSMEYQVQSQISQQKLFIELRVKTADLYRKINDAIAEYAKANGIALVFVTDDSDLSRAKTQQELVMTINMRKLIYSDAGFDITKTILEKMNAQYRLGGTKKP